MKKLTVLKLGWEFPPNSFGGLGVACKYIVESLVNNGTKITFILPFQHEGKLKDCVFKSTNSFATNNLKSTDLNSDKNQEEKLYGNNLLEKVNNYTETINNIVTNENFDIIHAHDWMCFAAGVAAKKITGKPLIAHIHATEFDRSGGKEINKKIYNIELMGMQNADIIITPSNFTKEKIIKHYNEKPERIKIIHNAIDHNQTWKYNIERLPAQILFLGRITLQKGPEYFLKIAQILLKFRNDVKFVFAGSGDLKNEMMKKTLNLGLNNNISFTGFLNPDEVKKIFNTSTVYIMPSISEPFGITALEATKCGIPIILSKQSGVSEVLNHCFKVDYWDINSMANIALSILNHNELAKEITKNAEQEINNLNWDDSIKKILTIYDSLT